MTSQLVFFRCFFLFIFLCLPYPKSEKKSCKSTNKNILALATEASKRNESSPVAS